MPHYTEQEIEQLRRAAYCAGLFFPAYLIRLTREAQPEIAAAVTALAEGLKREYPVLLRLDATGDLGKQVVGRLVQQTLAGPDRSVAVTLVKGHGVDDSTAAEMHAAWIRMANEALEDIKPRVTNRIRIYTDGACRGNPGPGGLGIVWVVDGAATEYAEGFAGPVTNSYMELLAVERALGQLSAAERKKPVTVYTDSQYVLNVLALGCKAKAHQELVLAIQAMMRDLKIEIIRVPGHADHWGNERADRLAHDVVPPKGAGS